MSKQTKDKRTAAYFHNLFVGPDSGRERIRASVFAQEYIRNGGDYDAAQRFAAEHIAREVGK